jgi:hypothetical protein
MIPQLRPLRAPLVLLLVSVAAFAAAIAARLLLLPDVLPIAAADDPQPLWVVEVAFLLRAIENIAALGAVLVLAAAAAHWLAPSSLAREP